MLRHTTLNFPLSRSRKGNSYNKENCKLGHVQQHSRRCSPGRIYVLFQSDISEEHWYFTVEYRTDHNDIRNMHGISFTVHYKVRGQLQAYQSVYRYRRRHRWSGIRVVSLPFGNIRNFRGNGWSAHVGAFGLFHRKPKSVCPESSSQPGNRRRQGHGDILFHGKSRSDHRSHSFRLVVICHFGVGSGNHGSRNHLSGCHAFLLDIRMKPYILYSGENGMKEGK